jgi:hypothetical protein
MKNSPDRKAVPPIKSQPVARKVAGERSKKTKQVGMLSKVPPATATPKSHRARNLLTITAALLGGIGLVGGGMWLSVQLIFDPDSILWLNQFLPEWTQIPIASRRSPQTLADIHAELEKQKLIAGEILPLTNSSTPNKRGDFLLPVLAQQANCNATPLLCQHIVELRTYQPTALQRKRKEAYFQMVSQVAVEGPEESFVITPLLSTNAANLGRDQPQPLTQIRRFSGAVPKSGIWLYLSGQQSRGKTPITYGQIVYYDVKRGNLSTMQQWTSPTTQVPEWREVTGGSTAELVVNQTVGLEPRFQIYQVKSSNSWFDNAQLEEITLTETTLDDATYDKALLLAKNGLWSTAEQWLRSLKRRNKGWSSQTQAQLDVITLHAQITRSQAEKAWSSPSQQVLANLVDGRWQRALQVFQSSPENRSEVTALLKTESSRLWSRVNAALKVDPAQVEVKAWGALILAAQKGKPAAIAWLRQQPKNTKASNTQILALLNQLDRPITNAADTLHNQVSRIVGTARPITALNTKDWLRLPQQPPLKLDAEQMWYEVQVATFQDGKRWRNTIEFDATAATLNRVQQQLGLFAETPLQILFWLSDGQQESIDATVQAVRSRNGTIHLLVSGNRISNDVPKAGSKTAVYLPRPLAFTEAAFEWAEPASVTLMDLFEQDPEQTNAILASLWQELQQMGLPLPAVPRSVEMLQSAGVADWAIQQIDLTRDQQAEVILTLDLQTLTVGKLPPTFANRKRVQTLVFTQNGRKLYSEIDRRQLFVAIANLGDSGLPSLLVDGTQNYQLLRWSKTAQRFE